MAQWKTTTHAIVALLVAIPLAGCGVVEDTWDGVTGHGPDSPEPLSTLSDTVVTIEVESDSTTSGELEITIDSARDSQSFNEESVELPFSKDFEVPSDTALPLRGSHAEVGAGADASWIECRILVNDQVVASHRSEGARARAVCDRDLQLGPS